MKRIVKWGLLLAAVALMVGLSVRGVMQRHSQAKVTPNPAPAVLELAPQDLVTVRRLTVQRTLPVSGTVEAIRTAVVKAKVAAELRQLQVREGQAVRAGQELGRLDATEFEARLRQAVQQAQAASAQVDIAERTLQNNRALVERGFISRNALDTAVSNAAAARASLLAAEAAVDLARKALDDTVLRAPIDGWVSQRFVQPGERVAVDARVLEIVDLSALELRALMPPEQVGLVRPGAVASLRVEGLAAEVPARVVRINPSAQAGTRAIPVYLAVQAREGLRHGLFASGRIEVARETALALPESAVRLDEAQPYVLVLQEQRLVPRTVQLDGSAEVDGEPVRVIRSGVAEGDRVLAGSIGGVRDGIAVRLTATPGNR
ncbi:MAG: efflux RND transporter periplasmic adaptor subunit [Tepidimonas sp.]|uniref:efflux RND transporter periplasmic adaptor subunit n=1 Tax=Tepidimonas sp. TaxID=2002775 RepID=UPI004054BF64